MQTTTHDSETTDVATEELKEIHPDQLKELVANHKFFSDKDNTTGRALFRTSNFVLLYKILEDLQKKNTDDTFFDLCATFVRVKNGGPNPVTKQQDYRKELFKGDDSYSQIIPVLTICQITVEKSMEEGENRNCKPITFRYYRNENGNIPCVFPGSLRNESSGLIPPPPPSPGDESMIHPYP